MPIIRRLAEVSLGPVDYFHLSTAEQFSQDWQGRRSDHVILVADNPDRRLSKILCDSKGLTLFLRDDPLAVVDFLWTQTSQDVLAATRLASTTFATLHDVVLSKPNLITIEADLCEDPRRFIELMASVLNFQLDATAKDTIAGETASIDAATSPLPHAEIGEAIQAVRLAIPVDTDG